MIGLMYKDLLLLKNNLKIMWIFIVLYIVLSFMGVMDISFVLPFLIVFSFISTFSWDDFNKWNAYAITLPNGRKNVVKSKYLLTLIIVVICFFLTIFLSCLITYTQGKPIDIWQIMQPILISNIILLIIPALMYPLIYKFGIEKARISFAIVFILFILGILLIIKLIPSEMLSIVNTKVMIPIICILVISVLYFISYLIARKIFINKEL